MFSLILARMCVQLHLLVAIISTLQLHTITAMEYLVTPQTCDQLSCENGNVCQTSLVNGTQMDDAHCKCRGEWAGHRCEAELHVSAETITSQTVTLKIEGFIPGNGKKVSFRDLRLTEVTLAVWNMNASHQCLIVRRDEVQKYLSIERLDRDQDYVICLTNGFIDSCSFFSPALENISTSPNCLGFRTKEFDAGPFNIGIVVIPCALVILIAVIAAFCYCNRRSLLLQLCLNIVCCRNCYCFRKHVKRRRQPMRKQREVSGEVLMPPDLPVDFSPFDSQISDFSERGAQSSNASSPGSRKSAYSLDPEGSVPILTSIDHNAFLYEDQSLIKPIYSPQDHNVMTLTFLDEDFDAGAATENPESNYVNPLHSGGLPVQNTLPRDRPSLSPVLVTNDQNSSPSGNMNDRAHNVQQQNEFPRVYPTSVTPLQEIPGVQNQPRRSRQHSVPHIHNLHREHPHPYESQPYRPGSHRQFNRRSTIDFDVKFRDPNLLSRRPRQRPTSLPFPFLHNELPGRVDDIPVHPEFLIANRLHRASLCNDGYNSFLPFAYPIPSQDQLLSRQNFIDSSFGRSPKRVNHLCSPSRYQNAVPCNGPGVTVGNYYNNYGPYAYNDNRYVSNTLPRSKKPRFVLPEEDEITDDYSHNTLPRAKKSKSNTKSPKRPSKLDLPTQALDLSVRLNSLPPKPIQKKRLSITSTPSSDTPTPSESKPASRQVKNLIKEFEHNLPFLRHSKPRPAGDEAEFRDLQSPIAEDRDKIAKKSRRSSFSKISVKKAIPLSGDHKFSNSNTVNPIFHGHPSDHIPPPFSTDDEEDANNANSGNDNNISSKDNNDESFSEEISLTSVRTNSGSGSVYSCYDDDTTNLVTPFCTEDSSDDDTYNDVMSLRSSTDTLRDIVDPGNSLLDDENKSTKSSRSRSCASEEAAEPDAEQNQLLSSASA